MNDHSTSVLQTIPPTNQNVESHLNKSQKAHHLHELKDIKGKKPVHITKSTIQNLIKSQKKCKNHGTHTNDDDVHS